MSAVLFRSIPNLPGPQRLGRLHYKFPRVLKGGFLRPCGGPIVVVAIPSAVMNVAVIRSVFPYFGGGLKIKGDRLTMEVWF
jgi:hypothetical protein